MSINQIYDETNGSVKTWQNYRYNNLNITDKFNIPAVGADPGDILVLDASLLPTWTTYSNVPTSAIKNAVGRITLSTIGTGIIPTHIPFTSLSPTNAAYSIVSGDIVVAENCSLLLFWNMSSIPTPQCMPIFQLIKKTGTNNITLLTMSPYRTQGAQDFPIVTCNTITPIQCIVGDRISIQGVLAVGSVQTCTMTADQSSLSIMRIA